jgi:DNA-binding transcriptional ArsR family regulator
MPQVEAYPALRVPHAAELFRLLAKPSCLRILYLLLEEGELHVNAVCEALGYCQASVSKELGALRRAGVVEYRREGRQNFYRVSSELVVTLLERGSGEWE